MRNPTINRLITIIADQDLTHAALPMRAVEHLASTRREKVTVRSRLHTPPRDRDPELLDSELPLLLVEDLDDALECLEDVEHYQNMHV